MGQHKDSAFWRILSSSSFKFVCRYLKVCLLEVLIRIKCFLSLIAVLVLLMPLINFTALILFPELPSVVIR